MSTRTSYDPGTPCWVELSGTPDVDASAAFYGAVLGWEIPELPNSAELGGYRRAKKDGQDVAGVSPPMQEGQPCVWATYVSVADADAAVARAGEAGGQTIAPVMDVMGLGKMAVLSDPTGAVIGVWEPGSFAGAELVNDDGGFGWNELGTRDVGAAREFYGAVFDWSVEDQDMGEMGTYHLWKDGDDIRGGMMDITGRVPDEVPSHWMVYFTVPDADAAVETAKSSGGQIAFGPEDIPEVGRFAIVQDPHGATFAVMAPTEETRRNAP
ncbi:MAG: VOC family protein [Actinobacteria bacterium]|nr:VOC family protein [Actinomycetota bacterium]